MQIFLTLLNNFIAFLVLEITLYITCGTFRENLEGTEALQYAIYFNLFKFLPFIFIAFVIFSLFKKEVIRNHLALANLFVWSLLVIIFTYMAVFVW